MTTPPTHTSSPTERLPEYIVTTINRYYELLKRNARDAPITFLVGLLALGAAIGLTLADTIIIFKSLQLAMPQEAVANPEIAAAQQAKAPPFLYIWLILLGGFFGGHVVLGQYGKLRKFLRAALFLPAIVLLLALGVVAAASYAPAFVEGLVAQRESGEPLDLNSLVDAAAPNWFAEFLTRAGGVGLAFVFVIIPVLTFVVADVCFSAVGANFARARQGISDLVKVAAQEPRFRRSLRRHNTLVEHLKALMESKPTPNSCAAEIMGGVMPDLRMVCGVHANHTIVTPPPHQHFERWLNVEALREVIDQLSKLLTIEAISEAIRRGRKPDPDAAEALPPPRPTPLPNGAASNPDQSNPSAEEDDQ